MGKNFSVLIIGLLISVLAGCGHGTVNETPDLSQFITDQILLPIAPAETSQSPKLQALPSPTVIPVLLPSPPLPVPTPAPIVSVKKILVVKDDIGLFIGDSYKFLCTVYMSDGSILKDSKKIKWESSDSKVVSVDPDGNIKALKDGTIYITAIYDNQKAKAVVAVGQRGTSSGGGGGSGGSGSSGPLIILPPPCVNNSVPTGLSIGKIAGLDLSWTPIKEATSYKVYKDGLLYADNVATTTQNINMADLCLNTSYNMQVSSVINCESAKSDPLNFNTNVTLAGLNSSNVSTTSFTLNWLPLALVGLSYNIYKDGVLYADNLAIVSQPITGLSSDTTYSMQISLIYNSCGESEKSVSLNVTTALTAPPGLNITNAAATTFTLNWDAVTGATSYKVYKDGVLYADNITDIFKNITELSPAKAYSMEVTTINTNGESEKSTALNVTTLTLAPAGLSADNIRDHSFKLSWIPVEGATSYKVYKDGVLYAGSVTETFKSITGLESATFYSMEVSAVNAGGELVKSTALKVKTTHHP